MSSHQKQSLILKFSRKKAALMTSPEMISTTSNIKSEQLNIADSLRCEIPRPRLPLVQRDHEDVLNSKKFNINQNIENEESKYGDKENFWDKSLFLSNDLETEKRIPSLLDLYQPHCLDSPESTVSRNKRSKVKSTKKVINKKSSQKAVSKMTKSLR
mmetsp:Transcript_32070/g.28433  ORF Transcript_32070/g.28433 Transcript_32070/m.28433 type:complete len:157 (+) Transcript_32070:622-1092(+)